MNTEKTIKIQAKKALEGNWSTLIAQIMFALLAFITLVFGFSFTMNAAGFYNVQELSNAQKGAATAVAIAFYFAAAAVSPLINGVYRSVCRIVSGNACDSLDVLYYFKKPQRFCKTVILNIISIGLFFIISRLVDVYSLISMLSDKITAANSALTPVMYVLLVLAWVASAAAAVVCYIIFVHYTFLAYGFNENLPIGFFLPKMAVFAVKNLGSTIKLFVGFIGWAALCFFAVPAFYVAPYFLTASAMSAKWLFELEGGNEIVC